MRWQKTARLAIAAFVLIFAAFVLVAMRQRARSTAPSAPVARTDRAAVLESGAGVHNSYRDGKLAASVRCGREYVYEGGRVKCLDVTISLPDRNGRSIDVSAKQAEMTTAEGREIGTARLTENITLKTSDGISVSAGEATYDDREGVLKVPGAVTFSRGRMSGKGLGATYDRVRDVLWLLAQAEISVAPDKAGAGALQATAGSAGLARAENYVRLSGTAHIVATDRTIDADEITAQLTPGTEDQRIQSMQLRGNSRITGTGGGAQTMSAKDIDLTYGEDGRTLQQARLMERSVVELPGAGGAPGRRIAARAIDMGMSPDGATLTALSAVDGVVLDLPPQADQPAKQIRSATLSASGPPGAGLQSATFAGNVEYRETRAAQGDTAAIDRTARALKLIVQTAPGLGDLQQADFHGNVKFVDGTELTAEAPRGLYQVARDRLDLSPSTGDPGQGPRVTDGQATIMARTIQLTMSSHGMVAETDVRSTLQRKPETAGRGAANGRGAAPARLPSMLKQDQPVSVTSNRLEYSGSGSAAKYTGNARLWQEGTEVRADTIELDDQQGNLTARGRTRTRMMFDDVDPKTKARTPKETIATSDTLIYTDAKRLAVYTGTAETRAHIVGPQGDLTGDRIDLYLKEGGNELDRAEADGRVVVIESNRTGHGNHLTYTASNETYVLTGTPVEVVEETPNGCRKTTAAVVRFQRLVDTVQTEARPGTQVRTETIPCPGRRS